MKNKFILLCLVALTFGACKGIKNNLSNTNNLTNTSWELTTLNGQEIANSTDSQKPIYFVLEAGTNRVGGFLGCNNFMGQYTLQKGHHIQFSSMATTRMACPNLKLDENKVLHAFKDATKYQLKGDLLTLKDSDGNRLATFKKIPENELIQDTQITDKHWQLKALKGTKITLKDAQKKEPFFYLKEGNNQAYGFAGCNTFSGQYNLNTDKRQLQFSKIVATLKACLDGGKTERTFFNALQATTQYSLYNDVLTLKDKKGKTLAVFEAIYPE